MDFPFPVSEVREGASRLLVPDVPRGKGPGAAGPWPFYNPTMIVNRDMSAIVLAAWPLPLRSALDGLAATGAWGIRMALEAGVPDVAFNDRSALSVRLIRENLRGNGITGTVHEGDFVGRFQAAPYDFVDIDPFGSPARYLGAALRSARTPYGLGITATDTAVLCGTYPATCLRRYGAGSLRCDQGAEIGLRILLGFCDVHAAEQGMAIYPKLCFGAEHFLRLHLAVRPRDTGMPLRYVVRHAGGEFVTATRDDPGAIGPLWMGGIQDAEFVRGLSPSAWTMPTTARLLHAIQDEAELPPFFVTTDELAARERGSPPKRERFIEGLREMGYRAARTHFHPRGVKTDATSADILRCFRERMPNGSKGDSAPAS